MSIVSGGVLIAGITPLLFGKGEFLVCPAVIPPSRLITRIIKSTILKINGISLINLVTSIEGGTTTRLNRIIL